ncbi:MAG: DUF1071 domain-containing protein [Methanobrevibacter sp.]|nr:DUF1071 domain-containing protein [Methanobrevibacter sp.]
MVENNYFEELNKVDCNDKIEKKNGMSYLSWAYAWGEVKKRHPDANYTIYENKDGWNYFTDGHTGWVKTGVTVNGIEHIEYLPIMDYKNKSIPTEVITSFDVNKTIQRSLTKACARHGLGLYIYAGEDLPEDNSGANEIKNEVKAEKAKATRELNKKVAEYNKSDEGLEMRYKNMYVLIRGMKQIDQYNKDKVLMGKVSDLLNELYEAQKTEAYEALNKLVNEKMLKTEPDEIPADICEKGEFLQAG